MPTPTATPYPITVSTSGRPKTLTATLQLTWPDGVCTETGIYYADQARPMFDLYARGIRFITGRANARTALPHVLELLTHGLDLKPAVDTIADWEQAPTVWAAMRGKTVITST